MATQNQSARFSVMATCKIGASLLPCHFLFLFLLELFFLVNGAEASSLTLSVAGAGTRPLSTTVFQILEGESVMLESPAGCSRILCTFDDNNACTGCVEFQVESGVGCKSSGPFATPNTCKSSSYSQLFNKFCPTAYSSYALDDACSTFACTSITIMLFLWLQRTADQSKLKLVFYMLLVLITLASAARPTLNAHNTNFIDATMHNSDSCTHCHRLNPAPATADSSHRNCDGNSPTCSPH